MYSRRSMLVSSLACCGCLVRTDAHAQQAPPTVRSARPDPMIACGLEPNQFVQGFQFKQELVRGSCGLPSVDAAIELERSVLNTFFRSILYAPEFYFYDDDVNPIGAKALKGKEKTTILLGLSLIDQEMQRSPGKWPSGIIGTLAHEWAHAFQFFSSLNEDVFYWETHADFLAGWYMGVKYGLGLMSVDKDVFGESLFLKGVPGQRDSFSPTQYGSPEQRVRAMHFGFDFGRRQARDTSRPDVDAAANYGFVIVRAMAR